MLYTRCDTELNVGQFACMACCPAINKCIFVFISELPSKHKQKQKQKRKQNRAERWAQFSID